MIVTIDLNVIVDVFLLRGEYKPCAQILSLCYDKVVEGYIPSHGIPTIYYILGKTLGKQRALEVTDKLLEAVRITPVDATILRQARAMNFEDFEDAIVAASAAKINSEYIITSNSQDFDASSIPAITPTEFMQKFLLRN